MASIQISFRTAEDFESKVYESPDEGAHYIALEGAAQSLHVSLTTEQLRTLHFQITNALEEAERDEEDNTIERLKGEKTPPPGFAWKEA